MAHNNRTIDKKTQTMVLFNKNLSKAISTYGPLAFAGPNDSLTTKAVKLIFSPVAIGIGLIYIFADRTRVLFIFKHWF